MTVKRVLEHIRAKGNDVYWGADRPEAVQQWMVPDDMTSVVHHFDPPGGRHVSISLTYDDQSLASKTDGALQHRPAPRRLMHSHQLQAHKWRNEELMAGQLRSWKLQHSYT